MNSLTTRFISSINDIDQAEWNGVCATDYPFLRHEFFAALENSGSTCEDKGWQPHHLIVSDSESQQVVAVIPLFLKTHSYGEYVFDWAWADAYHRHGIHYYPKLVNAIPMTPATGPRWAIDENYPYNDLLAYISQQLLEEAERLNASSCHSLFPEAIADLDQHLWLKRTGYQYHWFNEDYQSFDDFLAAMSSRKRKNIKKERQKIAQQAIDIEVKTAGDISPEDWRQFYLFYQDTYLKRSGHTGYLSAEFFPLLAQTMSDAVVMVMAFAPDAYGEKEAVAGALYFKDADTLYGRYWGCRADYDSLHFEACYYQGIEFAIKHRIKRFDPGAQGEHKIQRGFRPIKTYSAHWLAHPGFKEAIAEFLVAEQREVEQYLIQASELLPFKESQP